MKEVQQNSQTFSALQLLISQINGSELSDITPDADFHDDLGMSPMEMAQLFAAIHERFPQLPELSRKDLDTFTTVGSLGEYIEEELE